MAGLKDRTIYTAAQRCLLSVPAHRAHFPQLQQHCSTRSHIGALPNEKLWVLTHINQHQDSPRPSFCISQILWTFSIYLESVAILPQLFMISKTGEAETITTHYLFFLGLYRALYIANWVWRYHTENFYDQIAVVSGVVQTIFYCDFFYLYITKGR